MTFFVDARILVLRAHDWSQRALCLVSNGLEENLVKLFPIHEKPNVFRTGSFLPETTVQIWPMFDDSMFKTSAIKYACIYIYMLFVLPSCFR